MLNGVPHLPSGIVNILIQLHIGYRQYKREQMCVGLKKGLFAYLFSKRRGLTKLLVSNSASEYVTRVVVEIKSLVGMSTLLLRSQIFLPTRKTILRPIALVWVYLLLEILPRRI